MPTGMITEHQRANSDSAAGAPFVYRHRIVTRVTHWINLVCMTVLLMSGLQIFNARPDLYWGDKSDFERPALAMSAKVTSSGQEIGVTSLLGHEFVTTGWFGLSNEDGTPTARGFPAWATLPQVQWLAMGRRWHFFFAWLFVINGIVYLAASFANGHFWRDLVPSRTDLKRIPRTTWDHLRLRFHKVRDYNVLQKISYLIVVAVLAPFIVLAGLAMSPTMDAGFPFLLDLFGGRQSARTIHFILAFTLLAFVAVHILMVLLSGVWNNMRSMITGRYRIEPGGEK
jgi:thiosulfate reductase cytochrome b subunit